MNDPDNIKQILDEVEHFLLPKGIQKSPKGYNLYLESDATSTEPATVLSEMLLCLSIADYIRTLQSLYRDNFDELQLAKSLRYYKTLLPSVWPDSVGTSEIDSVPTKALLERITSLRCRSVSSCKICFGSSDRATFRAILDLGNSYALQGLWNQASEKVKELLIKLDQYMVTSNEETSFLSINLAIHSAERIVKVFDCLRKHVGSNFGCVTPSFIKEVMIDLSFAMEAEDWIHDQIPHPSRLVTSLHTFFKSTKSKLPLKRLSKSYFEETVNIDREQKSWGDLVTYFRESCDVMKSWMLAVDRVIIPQNKSAILVPFLFCDQTQRNLAHPVYLANVMSQFPTAMKLTAGSGIIKALNSKNFAIKVEINSINNQTILYELPLAYEEYLSLFVLECQQQIAKQTDILKIQATTLNAICETYTNNYDVAEREFSIALKGLEDLGLDMELPACELYNAIAQMMITKYSQWQHGRKTAIKRQIEDWMNNNEEGKRTVKLQVKATKKQLDYKSPVVVNSEIEHKAKQLILKKRIKEQLQAELETNEMQKLLDVAAKYLVRSFDIAESSHGTNHIVVATGCLAIASAQNLSKDFEETREWLLRALRIFEKCNPLPVRAIAFTQIQLGTILRKLGHDDECRRVLQKALIFYKERVLADVLKVKDDYQEGAFQILLFKDSKLYDEFENYSKLSNEIIELFLKSGDKWEATIYSEERSKIVETLYGWDSIEASEAHREVR
jgi:tetratricopeptide (TPR) repeat protein